MGAGVVVLLGAGGTPLAILWNIRLFRYVSCKNHCEESSAEHIWSTPAVTVTWRWASAPGLVTSSEHQISVE